MIRPAMFAAVAALMFCAPALSAPDTRTAAEYRAIADQMIAAMPDLQAAIKVANSNDFWRLTWRLDLRDTRLALDHDLAAAGVRALSFYNATWPEVSALERVSDGAVTNVPIRIALGKKYGTDLKSELFYAAGATLGELVSAMDEMARLCVRMPQYRHMLERDMKSVQDRAVKDVRKYLRRQGKSFVVKNGVNPCQEFMEELTAALNAPRLTGLNEWLAKVGCATRVDLSYLPPADAINELRDAILEGEREFKPVSTDSVVLRLALGVDGYNAFVKEYNGD